MFSVCSFVSDHWDSGMDVKVPYPELWEEALEHLDLQTDSPSAADRDHNEPWTELPRDDVSDWSSPLTEKKKGERKLLWYYSLSV